MSGRLRKCWVCGEPHRRNSRFCCRACGNVARQWREDRRLRRRREKQEKLEVFDG